MADRWHYGAPKGLLGRLFQLLGGGFTVRRKGPPPQPKKQQRDRD